MASGVQPVPTGTPGSSGPQPTAGAPAPQEAKPAETSFGAPASGAVQKDNRVPLERFQEVYNRMKGAEEENARLKAAAQQPVRSSEDRFADLRRMARESADDPDKLVSVVEQMAALKATDVVYGELKSLAEEQQKAQSAAKFEAEVKAARERMYQEFQELRDPNSEFFQLASQIYDSNENLKKIPDGEYVAANLAWNARARQSGQRPQNLAVPSMGAVQSDDFGSKRAEALSALRSGKMKQVEEFFTKNASRFIRKDR